MEARKYRFALQLLFQSTFFFASKTVFATFADPQGIYLEKDHETDISTQS